MKILLVFVVIVVISPSSHAAWWFSNFHPNNERLNRELLIKDDPVAFKFGDITCGAKATRYIRMSDRYVSELRELYCRTAEDTVVSTTVNCDYPRYSMESLSIQKGANNYSVTLSCGPSK